MTTTKTPRSPFHVYLSITFLVIALTGFSTTFFMPLAAGSFSAPAVVFAHGILLFAWLLLFIGQASLVKLGHVGVHRRLGVIGAVVAVGVVVSGIGISHHAAQRDLAGGAGEFIYGQFVNNLIEMAVFGALVATAIAMRRKPEFHKRLLVLATISALAPAWLRLRHLFPGIPDPFITLSIAADSLLLLVVARDGWMLRRVHPAYLWGGGILVLVHATELLAINSGPWRALGRLLLE